MLLFCDILTIKGYYLVNISIIEDFLLGKKIVKRRHKTLFYTIFICNKARKSTL